MSSFTFVRIPSDENEPIVELTASKAGGLEKDELIKYAKTYFQNQHSPPEDYPSCDIVALSIPLMTNGYQAVSLYSNNYGTYPLKENPRASAIVVACGHALPQPIRGDVFIGRAHDDESREWERLDFTTSEADAKSSWCRQVRSTGGGGGSGSSSGGSGSNGGTAATAASSLSQLLQQQSNTATTTSGTSPVQIMGSGGGGGGGGGSSDVNSGSSLFGMDGAPPVKEEWGTWTQSKEEVELRVPVHDIGIKSKDCHITFKRQRITVMVQKVVIVDGSLFDSIVPDDCTYTIETRTNSSSMDGDKNGRELCITLTKAEEGRTWSWVTTG